MPMKFYDDNLKGRGQRQPFREYRGINIRPDIVEESSNIRTYTNAYMPNRFGSTFFIQSSISRTGTAGNNFIKEPEVEDYYTMPQGTIVSVTSFPADSDLTTRSAVSLHTVMPEYGISATGEIIISIDRNGLPITERADLEWFNYSEALAGLFDICTGYLGGDIEVQDPYSQWDVNAVTPAVIQDPADGVPGELHAGQTVVLAWDNTAPAQAAGLDYHGRYGIPGTTNTKPPAGIVIHDIDLDIEGRHMNYSQQNMKGRTIMFSGKIRIPYVFNNKTTAREGGQVDLLIVQNLEQLQKDCTNLNL